MDELLKVYTYVVNSEIPCAESTAYIDEDDETITFVNCEGIKKETTVFDSEYEFIKFLYAWAYSRGRQDRDRGRIEIVEGYEYD